MEKEKSKILEIIKNVAIGAGIVVLSVAAAEIALFNLGTHLLAGV